VFAEYQSFDGHQMPTKIRQTAMGIEQVITLTKAEFGAIDKATFDLPQEIKALKGK
jgi:hypothetical protein